MEREMYFGFIAKKPNGIFKSSIFNCCFRTWLRIGLFQGAASCLPAELGYKERTWLKNNQQNESNFCPSGLQYVLCKK